MKKSEEWKPYMARELPADASSRHQIFHVQRINPNSPTWCQDFKSRFQIAVFEPSSRPDTSDHHGTCSQATPKSGRADGGQAELPAGERMKMTQQEFDMWIEADEKGLVCCFCGNPVGTIPLP